MSDDLVPGGPVEHYLDALFDRLAGTGHSGRRSLAEAEDHLRLAMQTNISAGLEREYAERQAVEQFGDAGLISTQLRLADRGIGSLVRPLLGGSFIIGVVVLLSLGISGLISEFFGDALGPAFVAGDPTGVTYTPSRCADYFEYFPKAHSCAAAAAMHHWGEIVQGRVALGVLGLIALAAGLLIRRALGQRWALWRPPAGLVVLVTVALAGSAAVGMLGPSLMELAFGGRNGVGVRLADGTVAAIVALGAAALGLRAHYKPTVR
ncbi:MAG: hypothetical protein J2P27_00660 [Actinobacteria bacterium]|nr:hypothetical protein [Actinomycetota bacterium]